MPDAEEQTRLFVGREPERTLLSGLLDGVEQGHAGIVVIDGEAGIGKTTLARHVCASAAARGFTVLWGTCVNFATAQVPYAPIARAVRDWSEGAGADDPSAHEARRIFGADGLTSRAASDSDGLAAQVILATDGLVRDVARQAPVLLVVDDLQWADVASLDLLGYLSTGLRGRRVGLALLIRTEDRPTGHRLHPWLADLRRQDDVHELTLHRMTEDETAALVSNLRPGVGTIVSADVHARTAGNPYFTELLASALHTPDATLPDRAPTRLREAVLARWHGLSAPSRRVTRIIAVGGRPRRQTDLTSVVARLAPDLDAGASIREAVAAGVLVEDPPGTMWLRHPLLADALTEPQPGEDDAATHLAFADLLTDAGTGDALASGEIVEHLRAAGDPDAAYRWAIVAADQAKAAGAHSEWCRALATASALWPEVSPEVRGSDEAHVALLRRTVAAEWATGRLDDSLGHANEALALVDEGSDPILVAELLLDRDNGVEVTATPRPALTTDLLRALQLAEQRGDSETHVVLLAVVAQSRALDEDPEPDDHLPDGRVRPGHSAAQRALEEAARVGTPRALAWASWGWGTIDEPDGADPAEPFARAYELAVLAGDIVCASWSVGWWFGRLRAAGRYDEALEMAVLRGAERLAEGDIESARYIAVEAAVILVRTGEWDRAREMIRSTHGSRGGGAGVGSVWVSALLGARSGEHASARRHIGRLKALRGAVFAHWELAEPEVELLLAEGEPERALATLGQWHSDTAWSDDRSSTYLAQAAAACADIAEAAPVNTRAEVFGHLQKTLAEMRGWHDMAATRRGGNDPRRAAVTAARATAETARLRAMTEGTGDVVAAFENLGEVARENGYPWEEAYAAWRLAGAMLRMRASRGDLGRQLRDAYGLAAGLGAADLVRSVERLAEVARVSLGSPDTTPTGPIGAAGLLTAREREVLAHLVAGRTNAEIAAELFISVKTAGIHVSNILRKTGTHSRAEARLWAAQHDEK